jgi:POT family proton-dependent oligopeptide transporter
MVTGMFVAAASFAIAATIQEAIDAQGVGKVNVAWQIIAYLVLTTSEVMVSITALEFAYTQAPKKMKSTVMGLFLLTVTAGNVLVSVLASLGDLPPAQFFWLFAGLACVVGVVMGARAYYYVPHDFPQE